MKKKTISVPACYGYSRINRQYLLHRQREANMFNSIISAPSILAHRIFFMNRWCQANCTKISILGQRCLFKKWTVFPLIYWRKDLSASSGFSDSSCFSDSYGFRIVLAFWSFWLPVILASGRSGFRSFQLSGRSSCPVNLPILPSF